jgi:hypothetical protein
VQIRREACGDRERAVNWRDECFDGAASVLEVDPAEVSEPALGEVEWCSAGVRGAVGPRLSLMNNSGLGPYPALVSRRHLKLLHAVFAEASDAV